MAKGRQALARLLDAQFITKKGRGQEAEGRSFLFPALLKTLVLGLKPSLKFVLD